MKIAFAGFRHGHIVGLYERAMAAADVEVVACCEEDAAARREMEEKRGVVFTCDSYDEIWNNDAVEAVAVGDYYGRRGEIIIRALEHGKHVICDKPICTDLRELEQIRKLAAEKHLKVCCMLDLRYMAQVQKAKEILAEGTLGKLHIMSFTGQHFLNYGVRQGWYFEEGKHGGTINDIAIHGIDLLRYITGLELTKIDCARVWNAFANKEPQFKDCGQFMAWMGDVAVNADVSYAAPSGALTLPTSWEFIFWCEKGVLTFGHIDRQIHIYTDKEEVYTCPTNGGSVLDDFIREINGEETVLNAGDCLISQKQILEIQAWADAH